MPVIKRQHDELEEVEYRIRQFKIEQFSAAVRLHGKFHYTISDFDRNTTLQLRAEFATLPMNDAVVVRYPTTWWDHLKLDLGVALSRSRFCQIEQFGQWLQSLVVYTQERYDAMTVLAGQKIPPHLGPNDVFEMFDMKGPRFTFWTPEGRRFKVSIDPNSANFAYDAVVGEPTKPPKPRQFVIGDVVQLDPAYAAQNPGARRAAQYVLSRNGPRPNTGRRNLHGHAILSSGKIAKTETVITWPVLCVGRYVIADVEVSA